MSEKFIGYLLLSLGVIVMSASVIYVWLIFTNKITPTEVVQAKSIKLDLSQAIPGMSGKQLPSQGMEVFSGEDMSKTINLSINFFLMTFIMLFGFRIASLGVMLMRPIVVKLKEQPTTQDTPS